GRRSAPPDAHRPRATIPRHRQRADDRNGERQRTRKDANEPGHANVLPRPTVRTGVIVLVPAFCRLRLRPGSPILSDKAAMKKASAAWRHARLEGAWSAVKFRGCFARA